MAILAVIYNGKKSVAIAIEAFFDRSLLKMEK
jgi:hypothetical protein